MVPGENVSCMPLISAFPARLTFLLLFFFSNSTSSIVIKLQAVVSIFIPCTTTIFGYAIGLSKTYQVINKFYIAAQMAVSL